MISLIQSISQFFSTWINRPVMIASLCFLSLVLTLVMDGTVNSILGLHTQIDRLSTQIARHRERRGLLEAKLKNLSNSNNLEQEAREQMDLVSDGDLIFIFQ